VSPCLIRLNWLLFSPKQQRLAKQLSKTKKTSRCKKWRIWLITCCPLVHTPWPYLYNSTLISLQLFKPTPRSLPLDLWLTWTLSHDHYLFELLTWSHWDSRPTWSPPQLSFLFNQIHHPWTLLGSVFVYPGFNSSLHGLKVLIPLWTRTPFQFGLVYSIFFSLPGQLSQVTFTVSAYLIGLPESRPNSLPDPHPSALSKPYWITSLFTRPYNRLTRSYPTSLPESHPNTLPEPYPIASMFTRPNHLTRFFSRSDIYLPSLTRSYSTELPYPILSRSDF
jgi:hypothetical protein